MHDTGCVFLACLSLSPRSTVSKGFTGPPQVPSTRYTLQRGMALWNMEVAELLWVTKTDTIALLAYSHDVVVLAFKGTSTVANCKTDANVWCLDTVQMMHVLSIMCWICLLTASHSTDACFMV